MNIGIWGNCYGLGFWYFYYCGEFGFGCYFIFDFGYVREFLDFIIGFVLCGLQFYFQYIVWNYYVVEFVFVDGYEIDLYVFVFEFQFGVYYNCCGLSYCFDDGYVWYDWVVWEMVLKMWFVYGDIFDVFCGLIIIDIDYFVYQ